MCGTCIVAVLPRRWSKPNPPFPPAHQRRLFLLLYVRPLHSMQRRPGYRAFQSDKNRNKKQQPRQLATAQVDLRPLLRTREDAGPRTREDSGLGDGHILLPGSLHYKYTQSSLKIPQLSLGQELPQSSASNIFNAVIPTGQWRFMSWPFGPPLRQWLAETARSRPHDSRLTQAGGSREV